MKAGLIVQACQAFIIQATFFVLPLYLQTVLGFDALQTGKTILPLSVALFVFALGGASMTSRFGAKLIVQRGLAALLVGEVVLLYFLGPDLATVGFAIGMALIGAGLGLMASQVGNVIMSSVDSSRGSEAGGLQGTSLNLGASLGVALVGSIVIAHAGDELHHHRQRQPEPARLRQAAGHRPPPRQSANFVSTAQVEAAATEAGLPADQTAELVQNYSDAQLAALRAGLAFLALFALLALAWVRRLPDRKQQAVAESTGVAGSEG